VQEVYGTLDCVVLPRCRSKLNDTVTPLKPLEAMAFNRLVGVSDVGGLVEVIGQRANAWMFEADNVQDLSAKLRQVYAGEIDVRGIAVRGREFVCRERGWKAIAERYVGVYAGQADA
jgi:glycosyltransferase involved in cell wall biosynthesis